MNTRTQVPQRVVPKREFIPFLFGEQLKEKEIDKLDLFEKGLCAEICKSDTIEQAVTKIVKMALAAEFGATMVKQNGADKMIKVIVSGILCDAELRKQALLIIDRYAQE